MENTLEIQSKAPLVDRLARQLLINVLAHLTEGCLQLVDGRQRWQFGRPDSSHSGKIEVLHSSFYRQVIRFGSIGAGEAYMKGQWRSPDLTAVIELFARNLALLDKLEARLDWLSRPVRRIKHMIKSNTISGAKRNILAHYDIGNDFYQLFLDPDMLYSSAIYPTPNASLTQAQQYKLKMICERLQLQPGMTLLEIGTGWGALAIYAARHYGVQVTTTTISDAQHNYAQQQIAKFDLTGSITLLKQDYRLLEGQYDRLVSIEMIEAVGDQYLPGFFAKLGALIKDDGLILIQAITIADHRHHGYQTNVDFIQKYIFPGGCLPSLARMSQLFSEQSNMHLLQLWDFGRDYGTTLRDWRLNFHQNLEQIKQLGYDEPFVRMWLFYLHYCEGGFRARATSVVHVLAGKQ